MTTRLVLPVDFALTTLRDAHDLVGRLRPGSDAPAGEWLAFRRRAAQIYRAVADIDRYHHNEAMYWVEHEQQVATELATHIHAQRSDTSTPE
ncbi:MAG: AMED_5909 family protein [Pseudonocardiaceae bacterium]